MRKQRKSKILPDKNVAESKTVKPSKYTEKEKEAMKWVVALGRDKANIVLETFHKAFKDRTLVRNKEP